MRLRRHHDDPALTAADPGGMPAPLPGGQPSPRDISSIGVAIMPGIPLPDWVTAASLGERVAGPPAAAPVAAAEAAAPQAIPAFPQVDPAYEALLAAPPAVVPQQAVASVGTPSYPQIQPAFDAGFAAPLPVAGVGATTGTALPPPDPAQWSEHPVGTVVWGPVPAQPVPAPAVAMPAQARVGDDAGTLPPAEPALPAAAPALATTTTSAAAPFAFAVPPAGPAFAGPPPGTPAALLAFDAADLEAPDLEPLVADTPAEPAPEAAVSFGQAPPFEDVLPPETPAQTTQTPRWFVTDDLDAEAEAPVAASIGTETGDGLRGAGQYGWLFQPDEPAARSNPGVAAGPEAPASPAAGQSASTWFDPMDSAAPAEPLSTAEGQPAEPWFAPNFDWMIAPDDTPAEAVVETPEAAREAAPPADAASLPLAEAPVAVAVAHTAAAPSFGPPPFGQQPVLLDEQPAAAAAAAVSMPALAAVPVAPAAAPPAPEAAVPAPTPAPWQEPAVPQPPAGPEPTPVAATTAEEPPATPDASSGTARSKRWLWIALAGLVLVALAAVAAFVSPGFLKSEPAVTTAPPTIVTPATAGDLTRTARVAPVAAAFRRTAVAAGAAETSQYATYAGSGTSATVWDSNGGSASPAHIAKAFTEAGGPKLGPLVTVPAGPRGGTMACAAVDATRSVCFWNGAGVLGGADIRGLGRSEAGSLAGQLRVALEQPAA